jgi:hypothetical protein
MTDLVPITDHELLVHLLKETADEIVAKKFIVEFRMANQFAFEVPEHDCNTINFSFYGYNTPHKIKLYPRSFTIFIDSDPRDFQYSLESIQTAFDIVHYQNKIWVKSCLVVDVRRSDEEDEED